jgi:CubicO group peptidase (beta-lactamase class C family)
VAEIGGDVEAGFEGVRDAFAANFAEHGEVGAACAVHVGGRKVVDIWGGVADTATGSPYGEDTLQLVFSTTKGATATCAHILAQRGLLDIDAPVVEYWPEFGKEGKADIPVRWLLCHKAGIPVIDQPVTFDEMVRWDPVIEALEVQAPVWEPGTAHGYHATTYGWLVGEVVRRIDGRSLGTFFADEVAAPLGLEFWVGLPEAQESRVAPVIPFEQPTDPAVRKLMEQFIGPDTLAGRALRAPSPALDAPDVFNLPELHRAELPAANGITNARSVSRMYAGMIGEIDGVRVLSEEQIDQARVCQTSGPDQVLMFDTTIGLGFWTSSAFAPYGSAAGFGHSGAGGSVGFGDPENGIAFGYVMNRMMQNLAGDPRTTSLIKATYDAVGVPATYV